MKEENRMMQDEMMNEEEIIGKEIEKELENTPEKNTEKNAQKEKMINLMNRYHSSTGADKAEVVLSLIEFLVNISICYVYMPTIFLKLFHNGFRDFLEFRVDDMDIAIINCTIFFSYF